MNWQPGEPDFDRYIEALADQLLEFRGYVPAARNLPSVLPVVTAAAEARRELEELADWPNEQIRESHWTINHALVAVLERRRLELTGDHQPKAD